MSYVSARSNSLFLKDLQEDQKHIDLLRGQRAKLAAISKDFKRLKAENQLLTRENYEL